MDKAYKIQQEDLEPIMGVRNHFRRCICEMRKSDLTSDNDYKANCFARTALLAFYNIGYVSAAIFAADGLASALLR
ncbi:Uncharacterised protein [uncultured archaeon]|nr:Uncharacterised protein [uncultured archaeon]